MLIRQKVDNSWLLGNPRNFATSSWGDGGGWGDRPDRVVPPNYFHLENRSEGSLVI